MKATQVLTEEYVYKSSSTSLTERLQFLEEFRLLLPVSVFEEHYQNRLKEWHETEPSAETVYSSQTHSKISTSN